MERARPSAISWMRCSPSSRGNGPIYYLLAPHLPVAMRHGRFVEDWGLVVDFIICTVILSP